MMYGSTQLFCCCKTIAIMAPHDGSRVPQYGFHQPSWLVDPRDGKQRFKWIRFV
jgi:hypothetical protein